MKSNLLPEALYEEVDLTFEDVVRHQNNFTTVTGLILDVRKDHNEIIVSLGNDLIGILPYTEFSIYPFTYKLGDKVPDQIKYMLNHKIRVKVTDIIDDNIILSRKKNMELALIHLKECSFAKFLVTNNTNSKLFGDIGDGIVAAVDSKELCRCRIRNASEILHKDDVEWMKILNCDELNRFNMSYKEMFEQYNPENYKPNDGIWCTVNEPVDETHSGYYVAITPQINGIMDVKNSDPILPYGRKVFARVKSANENGVKLYFIGF